MSNTLRPTWGYKATGEAQIFVLGEGEDLPPGWNDSPAAAEPEPVTEPESEADWRKMHWKQRVKMAKDLTGNADIETVEQADAALEVHFNG